MQLRGFIERNKKKIKLIFACKQQLRKKLGGALSVKHF